MRIIRIADGGVPAGFVEIEFDIGEQDQKASIVAHGPGTGCGLEDDDQVLKDLMEAEVGGFGSSESDDGGLTSEGYAEKNKGKQQPKSRWKEEERQFGQQPGQQQEEERKKYDAGFGSME